MIACVTRVSMIAFIVFVLLGVSAGFGQSSEVTSEDIFKRLEEMGQKLQDMEAEIKALKKQNEELETELEREAEIRELKKQNEELKAELKKMGKGQAETPKEAATTVKKRPPVKVEPLIKKKPFKGGIQLDAEYLYLTANRNAEPYAGRISGYGSSSYTIDADAETECGGDNAWRVGLSYVALSGWDVGLKYMHFGTQGDDSIGQWGVDNNNVWVNQLDRSLADDILNHDFDDGIADYAEQELKLALDIWDAEVGHTFRTTDHTTLRLFGGFRYIDMDNDSEITYEDWYGGDYYVANIDDRLDMNGYGGRIGGTFIWDIWNTGLSVNFGSALSLMYANFDATRQDDYASPSEREIRKVSSDIASFLPIVDLNLGLKYQYKWFFIEGGYLFSYWFNGDLKHQIGGYDDVDGGTSRYDYERADLSIHGWTIKGGIVF